MKGLLTVLLAVGLTIAPSISKAAPLQLQEIEIDVESTASKKQPLTDRVIELKGPEQEVSFFYEMKSDSNEEDQALALHYEHSELLIAPSSLTVEIDGQPLRSVLLTGDNAASDLRVPLKGTALKRGIHEVKVSFYGVIKEGVCVEQGTSGNWLALQIDSHIQLNGQQANEEKLASYPTEFIGTGRYPSVILIPDQATLPTLDSALKVGAFLSEWSNEKFPVNILRESDIKSLSSNVLIMGAVDEFTSDYVQQLIQQAKLSVEKDVLTLSYETLRDSEQQVNALFALATTPEALSERIAVLTEPSLFEQLVGQQLAIQTLPVKQKDVHSNVVKLKQFGLANVMLTGANRESLRYFHYAPFTIDRKQATILELHLKRSALDTTQKTVTEEVFRGPIELTVLVNDVPHSINLDQLEGSDEELYTVQLPIEPRAIKDNRMISLQLQASGLLSKNPCVTTDHHRWLSIDEDSFFIFSEDQTKKNTSSFAEFPSPFIDDDEQALVILPTVSIDDNSLLYLYRKLFLHSRPMNWRLADGGTVEMDAVSDRHLLFIGGPDVQPLLQEKQKDLSVTYGKNGPELASLGFLQESVKAVGWIQGNVWNTENHSMLVLDWLTETPQIDRRLVDFLQLTDEVATVAVTSANRKVYTNAVDLETQMVLDDKESVHLFSALSSGWWIGLVVLLSLGVGSVVYVLRRRR